MLANMHRIATMDDRPRQTNIMDERIVRLKWDEFH